LHENLFRSEPHRVNLLRADFTEIGVGIRSGPFRYGGVLYQATMVTVDFGSRGGSQYFTGVAYEDSTAEPAFALGHGRNSVTVTAVAVDGSGTFTTTTGASGGYALAVPPGTYDLKAQGAALPQSIEHRQVTLGTGNVKVDFVAGETTSLGVSDDVAMCGPGQSVNVAVLTNDTGPAAQHPELVQIVDAPQHGVATANPATGEVLYVPELGYLGLDRFTYRVADTQGNRTAPAQVQVTVLNPVYHPWQNPQLAADVNGDGYITPLDALQLINRLNAQAPGALPTPSPQGSFPLPYLDVNGDADVTAMDVLLVINRLNSPANGEGESAAVAAPWQSSEPAPATQSGSGQEQRAPAEAGPQAIHLVGDSTAAEQPAFGSPLARKIDEHEADQERQ
jgi:hypothetical protein